VSPQDVSRYDADRGDVLELVPQVVRSLLDVGCDTGRFGAQIRTSGRWPGLEIVGVDPCRWDTPGLETYDDVVIGRYPEALDPSRGFECVAFNDVLEHMDDPWAALEATHQLLEGPRLVVGSVPNVRNAWVIIDLVVRGDFRYRDVGILDRTHLRFFTRRSLERMLEETGYVVEAMESRHTTELRPFARLVWRVFPGVARAFLSRQITFRARSVR